MSARLSLLTFPQSVAAGKLKIRVLIVPCLSSAWNGDPLKPMFIGPGPGDTAAPIADADLRFQAHIMKGLEEFPVIKPGDPTPALPEAGGNRPDARALFQTLSTRFTI